MGVVVRLAVRFAVRSLVVGGMAYGLRKQLVHLLTKTTGTWVGTPDV